MSAEMYAGRIACCTLVSHGEYAPRALVKSEKYGADRQTDGRQTGTLRLPLDAASVISLCCEMHLPW